MTSTLALGVIGNCQLSALIDRQGRYVWMCLPRLDGDPVFCSLLRDDPPHDPQGTFAIEMDGATQTSQSYERNTAVLETIVVGAHGLRLRILDFCPRFRQFGRNYRPVMVVRIVEPLDGHPTIRVRLRPLSEYGGREPSRHLGSNHVRFDSHALTWRMSTDMSLNMMLEERPIILREPIAFIFGADEPVTENIGTLSRRLLDETRRYWRDWSRELAIPFEWQAAVIRAAITLKLCSFEDTGAVVAALTTSIPEARNSGRNWDYRYCWLRDSYFTIQALNRLGATRTMEGYLRYISNVFAAADGAPLQPVYGISGAALLTERINPQLVGYRGMGPVRVGNQAYEQIQHDVYGALILASTQTFFDQRLHSRADVGAFQELEVAGERCWQLYDQPDAGIWEFRGRMHVHTFSSAISWAGVDRLVRIAEHLNLRERAEFWRQRAADMRQRILDATWSPEIGCFSGVWHTPIFDASVLLLAELGFVRPDDPRFIATVEQITRHLRRGDYVLRYNLADDFGMPENAFNICTFWYINALASIGRRDEARALFDNMLERCNHLGLLSEDLDPVSNELWGNYPQTYSMLGIINGAMRLSRSWEDAL